MRSKSAPPRRSLFELRAPIPAALGYAFGAAAVGLVFIAWCVASYVQVERDGALTALVPHYFLPAPDAVLKGLLYLIFERNLFGSLAVSALRIAKAIALSIAVAFPLGIAMGSFEAVRRALDPLVAPMRYLPITAFIPLLILWFGIDEGQKVAFLFLGTSVYLIPAVTDAVRAVPEQLVQTALTLGATRLQVVRTVLVPAALPQIFDGFRVLNAISWTYIILAEIVNPQSGIGYILRLADQHLKPEWSFAGIFVVGVVGILTDLTIRGVNQLLFHDQRSNG